jgi:hypothetical protein
MNLENFLHDPISLLTAIGALLSALASLIKAIIDLRKSYQPKIPAQPDNQSHKDTMLVLARMPAFIIGVLLLLVSIATFIGRSVILPPPLNVQLTSDAWDAYNHMDYTLAILKADECISRFELQAINQQDQLVSSGSPMPPLGFVSDEEEQIIFSRGVLNDVATCYLIKGQSLEKLNRINEAKDAYQTILQFSYARAWDRSGGFWSPADAAGNRLARLP